MTRADQRPRVLFVGPYPPPYSGPELGMKLFLGAEELQRRFDIEFVQTNFRTSNVHKGKLDASSILGFFLFFARFTRALLRYRPSLVYYPVTTTPVGWVGRDAWVILLAAAAGSRVVIHLRGSHLKLNLNKFDRFTRGLVRLSCRKVNMAIVQAVRLMDQFEGLVPEHRIRVLYNAIDTTEYARAPEEFSPRPKVLFLGHMTKAKGYIDLMRALPLVVERMPEALFQVCGTLRRGERGVFFDQSSGQPITYEDPFEIHEAALAGPFNAHYDYRGVVEGPEKLGLLRACAVFALPSYSEGMSRAVLEAMAIGRPIVATPVGAHPEIIREGENGFLISPGDVQALADALLKLLRDPEMRRAIGDRNSREVQQRFSASTISSHLADYFTEALQ